MRRLTVTEQHSLQDQMRAGVGQIDELILMLRKYGYALPADVVTRSRDALVRDLAAALGEVRKCSKPPRLYMVDGGQNRRTESGEYRCVTKNGNIW